MQCFKTFVFVFVASFAPAYAATITTYTTTNQAVFTDQFLPLGTSIVDTAFNVGDPWWKENTTVDGFTIGGVNFLTGFDAGFDTTLMKPVSTDLRYWGVGYVNGPQNTAGHDYFTTVTLPQMVNAIWLNLMTTAPAGRNVSITIPGQAPVTFATNPHTSPYTPTWVAIVSDTMFNSFQLRAVDLGTQPLISAVGFGNETEPAETAEVATFLLIASGLLLFRWLSRVMPKLRAAH